MWSPDQYDKDNKSNKTDQPQQYYTQGGYDGGNSSSFQQYGGTDRIWSPTRQEKTDIGSIYDPLQPLQPTREPNMSTNVGGMTPPPSSNPQHTPSPRNQVNPMNVPIPHPAWDPRGHGEIAKCVFLPCPRNGNTRRQDEQPRELVLNPYPRTKRELEEFFMKNRLFYSEGENYSTKLTLQFFIVHKSKPVITFRKSEGMQPWKQTNKLCENWIADERFKRFYGPVVLLKLENSASFSSSDNQHNVPLVLKNYTIEDYNNHIQMNRLKSKNIMQNPNFVNPSFGFDERSRTMSSPRKRISSGKRPGRYSGKVRVYEEEEEEEEETNVRTEFELPKPLVPTVERKPVEGELSVDIDKEKLEKYVSDNVSDKMVLGGWNGLYYTSIGNRYSLLSKYCEIVIKTAMKQACYVHLGGNLYVVNSGLKSKGNVGLDLFFVFEIEERDVLNCDIWSEIQKIYNAENQSSGPSPKYVFDSIPIHTRAVSVPQIEDIQNIPSQKTTIVQIVDGLGTSMDTFKQFDDFNLIRFFNSLGELFPKAFLFLSKLEREYLFKGFEQEMLNKIMNDPEDYVVQCANVDIEEVFEKISKEQPTLDGELRKFEDEKIFCVADMNPQKKHYLIPLNFYADSNYVNFVVEIEQTGAYFVAHKLLTYDHALLKARLIRNQTNLGWLSKLETNVFEILLVEKDNESSSELEEEDVVDDVLVEGICKKICENDDGIGELVGSFNSIYYKKKLLKNGETETESEEENEEKSVNGLKQFGLTMFFRKTVYQDGKILVEGNLPVSQNTKLEDKLNVILGNGEEDSEGVVFVGKDNKDYTARSFVCESQNFAKFDLAEFNRFNMN